MAKEGIFSQFALDCGGTGMGPAIALALGGAVQIQLACAAALDLTSLKKTELRNCFAHSI
jgi:hypothetical protein